MTHSQPAHSFTGPAFTASTVAAELSRQFAMPFGHTDEDEWEGVDGEVTITGRVHVQVGSSYLIVAAWVDDMAMRSWPARSSIFRTLKDLKEAMTLYPGAAA